MRRMFLLGMVWAVAIVTTSLAQGEKLSQDTLHAKISKATIAALMGRKPATMNVKNYSPDTIWQVSYVRESDGTAWKYLCKFEGKKVIWTGLGTPSDPQKIGRGRDHPADEVITYAIEGDEVTILQTFSSGSTLTNKYTLSDL